MVTVWPQSFRNRLNVTNGQRLGCVKGAGKLLNLSVFQNSSRSFPAFILQIRSAHHGPECLGLGIQGEGEKGKKRQSSRSGHQTLWIHTWSYYWELLQGRGCRPWQCKSGTWTGSGKWSLCWDGQRTDINWGWWSRRQKNPIGKRKAQRPWGRCLDSAAKQHKYKSQHCSC